MQTLILVKVPFTKETVERLCDFVEGSHYLKILDISWSELSNLALRPILRSLGKNTNLQDVNLSHNQLSNQMFSSRCDQNHQLVTLNNQDGSELECTDCKSPISLRQSYRYCSLCKVHYCTACMLERND